MNNNDVAFEESLSDVWDEEDRGVAEVSLNERPLFYVGAMVVMLGIVVACRIFFLGVVRGDFYSIRSEVNLGYRERVPAPRGIIEDRFGNVIAENRAVFSALLNVREFLKQKELQDTTLSFVSDVLEISADEVWTMIRDKDLEKSSGPIVLAGDITHAELVAIKEAEFSTITAENDFARSYPEGSAFSSLLGYIGFPTQEDMEIHENLTGRETIGKSGLEVYYDSELRGAPGLHITMRSANGAVIGEQEKSVPIIGETIRTTIDADLQKYFFARFEKALLSLGRTSGVGMALNPRNGEVLALLSFPSFDNNIFTTSGKNEERLAILSNSDRPLFNRAVGGAYTPGSTIKPLVGVAALAEGVISTTRTIFSPGYLDVPNPYNPENPSRFEDWRYQGDVDLASALAQSSNVYFYTVGGGANGIKGLGITRLRSWWQKFGFGEKTGVDMPGEVGGFLPSAEWKQDVSGRPWLLGDTYNVSIGQGDLMVTPLQLVSYIAAIGNGGTIYKPHINGAIGPIVNTDLRGLSSYIEEVQRGMRATVTNALGTAHIMDDLPFPVSGKTGSAQVKNNKEENAFFVGYAPSENPEIAILVLVENSKQGSLNAVPIAEDVLRWYYENRIK